MLKSNQDKFRWVGGSNKKNGINVNPTNLKIKQVKNVNPNSTSKQNGSIQTLNYQVDSGGVVGSDNPKNFIYLFI